MKRERANGDSHHRSHPSDKPPVLAVSVGCPAGVGPEVAVLGASRLRSAVALLVGDPSILAAASARRLGDRTPILVESARDLSALRPGDLAVLASSERLRTDVQPGTPTSEGGRAQLRWIDQATELVTRGIADALVTGPVSKSVIASSPGRAAKRFLGHTEHLARELRSKEVVMAFWSETIVTALVTTHLALRDVPSSITRRKVASSAYWLARLLTALEDGRPSRLAVAALNPHAGEDGLLGDEESRVISPGIAAARRRLAGDGVGVELCGPLGAETAIRKAAGPSREYAAVLAMYHDQATIPEKLVAFGDAVNVTLGLPIVRTSVDHGTGYDVAGTGHADPGGMIAALELAARLVRSPRPPI